MQSITENLADISLIKLAAFILAVFLLAIIFNFHIADYSQVILLLFFIYELRGSKIDFKGLSAKNTIFIVVLNIFFSYGMLYFTYFILNGHIINVSRSIAVYSLINAIFISPIVEELLFRGVLFNCFNEYFNMSTSIILSAVLFAISHQVGGIISAFVFGLCMSILYLKTSNIVVPIFAHFLNNLFSQIIYYVDVGDLLFSNIFIISIISILAVISLYFLFNSLFEEFRKII